MDVLTDPARHFLAATAPEHTETQAEMADLADEWGFPIIGPEAGAVLRLLARAKYPPGRTALSWRDDPD